MSVYYVQSSVQTVFLPSIYLQPDTFQSFVIIIIGS